MVKETLLVYNPLTFCKQEYIELVFFRENTVIVFYSMFLRRTEELG